MNISQAAFFPVSKIARCLGALALLGAVTTAAAQSLRSETDSHGHVKITNIGDAGSALPDERVAVAYFKQTDADKRVSYSDGTDAAMAQAQPEVGAGASRDVASALARNAAMSSRRAALVDASEAMRRLVQARLERARGLEPLPGEDGRIAAPDGAPSRYQLRQNLLNSRVESAQLRVSYTRR